MFVVCFGQGLGNQMFQYAFYLSLKKKYPKTIVKMDIDNILEKDHNGFELARIFGIRTDECTKFQAVLLSNIYPKKMPFGFILHYVYLWNLYIHGMKDSFINQDNPLFFFDELYELSPLKSYLFLGRWIHEDYLKIVKEELYKEFIFPEIIDSQNKEYQKMILDSESVSIHIRGGDYLSDANYYMLTKTYYKKAIDIIKANVNKKIRCFVFTDDMNYAKNTLDFLDDVVYVQGNHGNTSYIDMQLMTLCHHNIIANSTFSFWGAYLNRYDDKIVVAPDKFHKMFNGTIACSDWKLVNIE